ncbi:Alpha/Beta hydrolase protein [Hygrophoropsis aurantiaca]|uniref:Alpha/Beta hydrolase protein n=1 Tax=Hygrophoropsis aurantiaca TaxID=72124 RepID=A0ACB8ATT2_9AGAM|nr:Alpha/Beta hydrolase protein [Hygrophoropsis aurantiaca]
MSIATRVLSPEQQHMYASERLVNFRLISKLVANRSPHVLSNKDLAPSELHLDLSRLGQLAELAYSPLPIEIIFDSLDLFLSPGFPLEGYDALKDSHFMTSFQGVVADLLAYVVYRPHSKQLVMAISGTSSLLQATYTLRANRLPHKAGKGCRVHSGFWQLYEGLKPQALDVLRECLEKNVVDEIVLTGHSMGGALCHLLAFDLLTDESNVVSNGMMLQVVTFGAPRCGNLLLVHCWRNIIKDYRAQHGENAIKEYAIKGYNDGVPSLPPVALGFRHFAEKPLYYFHGQLYFVPEEESERALFDCDTGGSPIVVLHPRGGHNYYSGRDMERALRRMCWVKELQAKDLVNWEELYRTRRKGKFD